MAIDFDPAKVPEGLGGAKPIELPATRYFQGGRTMYHVTVVLAQLPQLVVKRPDPNRLIEGNRRVDASRARRFGSYLQKNEDWVSPAIIVRAPSGEVTFRDIHAFGDGSAWGVLSIPLPVLTEVLILDGQHRTLGTFMALDEVNDRVSKVVDLIAAAERDGDRELKEHHTRELARHKKLRDRLGKEHISVDIAVVTGSQAKQMFADINNNAKGVNPDYTTFLDQRDVVNRISVKLIEDHPLLEGRVEIGQERRMSPTNANFIGARTVADIVRAVEVESQGGLGVIVSRGSAKARTWRFSAHGDSSTCSKPLSAICGPWSTVP